MQGLSIRKYAEIHQINRGSVDYQQKKFFSTLEAERAGRSGRQMPSASLKIKSIISDQERLPTGRRSCFISEQCRTAAYLDEK